MCGAVYAGVVAYRGSDPVGSEVTWVGVDYLLPGLEGKIGLVKSGVCHEGVVALMVVVSVVASGGGVAVFGS